MLQAIAIVLFVTVLTADFVIEINREEIRPMRAIIRALMVLACAYLL